MNYTIIIKKLGNRWYLDINHLDPSDILFNDKLCKVFNLFDKNNNGKLYIHLIEEYSIIYQNTIFINDEDLLRYFTTMDSFDVRFMISDHEFSISAEMYNVLECELNLNFHKTCYRIEISD